MIATKPRLDYIDVAKGILIILVVLGHSSFPFSKYIYWFHMPSFFIISGFFIKPYQTYVLLFQNIKTLLKKLFIPYILYMTFFFLISRWWLFRDCNWSGIFERITPLLIGGREISGQYAIFWFISTLFIAKVIVYVLNYFVKDTRKIFLASFLLFSLGSIEGYYLSTRKLEILMPLNADVALIAQFFLFIGQYYYSKISKISIKLTIFLIALVALVLVLDFTGLINYNLDMKSVCYNNPLFLIIVPQIIFLIILQLSLLIVTTENIISKLLIRVGKSSLTIMYLHIFVVMNLNLTHSHYLIYTIVGISIPLFIDVFFFDKNKHSIPKNILRIRNSTKL